MLCHRPNLRIRMWSCCWSEPAGSSYHPRPQFFVEKMTRVPLFTGFGFAAALPFFSWGDGKKCCHSATAKWTLNWMLRVFSHKINFNFRVFIRPKHTILLAANVRCRRWQIYPVRSRKESTVPTWMNEYLHGHHDRFTASLCADMCIGCSLGLFFASLWVCVAAWGVCTDREVGWGHGWAERRWEDSVVGVARDSVAEKQIHEFSEQLIMFSIWSSHSLPIYWPIYP